MLPPGSGAAGIQTEKHSKSDKRKESVAIPTADGGYVTLQEPVKKIGNRELATLSPEEKKFRRLWTNAIVIGGCVLVMLVVLAVLILTT